MKKRLLAGLLAICLALALCPAALADEDAAALAPSEEIAEFIKLYESFSPQPYSDDTGWYIGYGVACDPEDWPDGITEEEASQLLWDRLESFAGSVHTFLDKYGVSVTQGQFDALVSMTYNFGSSWLNVSNRLPMYLTQGVDNYSEREIVNAFGAWCHIDGAVNEPLLRRRIAEAMAFLHDDYSRDVSAWSRLDIDAAGGSVSTDVWCYRTGQSYGTLPAATRSGYTLEGWRKDDGTFLTADDIASGTTHVTAVWNAPVTASEVSPKVYPDVTPGDWFYGAVTELSGKNVISGYDDGLFHPLDPVARGQALKLLLLAAGYGEQSAGAQHWAAGYRSFAAARGFIRESDYANLDAVLVRDEIADLAAAVLKLDTSAYTEKPFADSTRPSVLALYGEGIIEGTFVNGQRVFNGSNVISRSEMAAIVQRISAYAGHGPLPPDPDPDPDPAPTPDPTPAPVEPTPTPAPANPAMNNYDLTKFRTEKNEDDQIMRIYYDDPAYDVRYGIDVSYYQGSINWQKVAADGISFAILRAGGRGYGSLGTLYEDTRFREYAQGAAAAGLDIGLYFFSQAINPGEAELEARYLLDLVKQYGVKVTFPIAFDWEPIEAGNSRTRTDDEYQYDYSVLTDCALAFCRKIEEAGYTPVVYTNPSVFYRGYDPGLLSADYDIWLAHYTERTNFPYDFKIWQYGSSGSVNGISGRVDMDIAFYDYAKR